MTTAPVTASAPATAPSCDEMADALGCAIMDVLAQRRRTRYIRYPDAHATVHVGRLAQLVVKVVATGILGMPVHTERTVMLEEHDVRDRPDIAVSRALDRIECAVVRHTGSALIGHVRRTVDPVLARMVAVRPAEALSIINAARITAFDDDDELRTDEAFRTEIPHAPNQSPCEHLTSAIHLAEGCTWRSDVMAMELDRDLPETVRASLVGRDLADLVEHELVPRGITITGFDDEGDIGDPMLVNVTYEAVPLADVLRPEDLPVPPAWLDGKPIDFRHM